MDLPFEANAFEPKLLGVLSDGIRLTLILMPVAKTWADIRLRLRFIIGSLLRPLSDARIADIESPNNKCSRVWFEMILAKCFTVGPPEHE